MIETPETTQTADQHYAYVHLTIPREEIRTVMGPGIREVYAAIAAQSIPPVGPWFTHHLKRPDEFFDFEICVPVSAPIAAAGRVQAGIWPSMRIARTVYHGDYDKGEYEGLAGAWPKFLDWIAEQGLTTTEDLWERYLVGPETSPDPGDWRTELNKPLLAS
jgi:effector-binding domain-containing protein